MSEFDPTMPIDFSETPNEVPVIDAGCYLFNVLSETMDPKVPKEGQPPTNLRTLVVVSEIISDGPMQGRQLWHRNDYDSTNPKAPCNVGIKQYCMAVHGNSKLVLGAGVGKKFTALTVNRPNKNEPGKFFTNIKEFVISPETLAANQVR